jgi:ferredoxin-thioredoxin reductase catalytic chain
MDKSVTAVVIQGLAEHKDSLGAPLCPCRHYDDKQAEVEQGYWNCPCVPMRERKVSCFEEADRHGLAPLSTIGKLTRWGSPATELDLSTVQNGCLQECHCMLFLTEDNPFVGKDQGISTDEIKTGTQGM